MIEDDGGGGGSGLPTPFERLGGLAGIEALMRRFVRRVFDDTMIGFLFARADYERIVRFETQHAARALGGPVAYEGKPLPAAHRPHPITGGHFGRRLVILAEVLAEAGVPGDLAAAWLDENRRLREQITPDQGSECRHPPPSP